MICDECETVAHCMKNGCVPKTTKKDEAFDPQDYIDPETGEPFNPVEQLDLFDFIAGALGVSRGTAYDMIREALAEQPAQQEDGPINEGWQITVANGHSGYGVYAHMEDYPEEGAVLVQTIEQPAQQEYKK